ncbi:dihydroxyacetone kinase-like protein [Nocardiopsis mwathae]|uniref:Dihydroxyacetone kinase-like protein n=1 Tax=Nocardiopsis mwathae TaxID=1472723 RepID=A0A7W9YJA2_9ACTN|nr:dihydroxyacetone kinase subunit DhaL [Nocardiopsis mwathae]MBB6173010.1 dihydroxyacetone kinase-like protein [Nocardiopsis mwathae]
MGTLDVDVATARAWLQAAATSMDDHADHLSALDAAIGDGDHGTNMRRGFSAVADKLAAAEPATAGELLTLTGRTLISTVGGASGPLYGSIFRAAGKRLAEPTADLAEALRDGLEAVQKLGGAQPGDKTIVDAYTPAVDALAAAVADGADPAGAARAAATAADEGAQATIPLLARKGRASYLGERSIGHQDPGATSTALIFAALADTLEAARQGEG